MTPSRDRAEWDAVWLDVATAVAQRSSCSRSQVGAIVVVNNFFTFVGYNGPRSGERNCNLGGCPRGLKTFDELPSGAAFDDSDGFCTAVHAEINALNKFRASYIGHPDLPDSGVILYTTRKPCNMCQAELMHSGFGPDQVIWRK